MTPLTVRPAASRDVHRIARWIAVDNEAASWRFLDAVADTWRGLQQQPGLGRPRPDLGHEVLRSWRITGFPVYLNFYLAGTAIEIVRVLDGRRELRRVLAHAKL